MLIKVKLCPNIGRFMRGMYIACTEELMFEIAKKGQKNGLDVQMKEL